ncbi:MAG: hypothetical protein M3Y18_08110 [Candidatus Eremiobacteraeota bacterium]|nr:hypothetical protein [Candidatus Eremiobacteraeota bacterium]
MPAELLALARGARKRSVFVVGTAKNVGKTVVTRSIARAAHAAGLTLGITSIGRDGERVDASDGGAKPQLFLREGTVVATARTLLPGSPASEVLDISKHATAAGNVVFARVRLPGRFEIAGPPTASGVRTVVERLFAFGCDHVVVDGAIDRLAALAGGDDAIVLATGAASGATADEVVEEIAALAARLQLTRYDPREPFVRVDGALTADMAAAFVASGERRQIVVRDPTQVTISGRAFRGFVGRLRLRCGRPLHVVAATACAFARDRSFSPRNLLCDIAAATGLPAFDVYAGTAARP